MLLRKVVSYDRCGYYHYTLEWGTTQRFIYPLSGTVVPMFPPDLSDSECASGLHITYDPNLWKRTQTTPHVLVVQVTPKDVLAGCLSARNGHCQYDVDSKHYFVDKLRVARLTVVRCLTCDSAPKEEQWKYLGRRALRPWRDYVRSQVGQ